MGQTADKPNTQYRSVPVAAASARGCSGSLAFMGSPPLISRRVPRQRPVEVTAVEDGMSCGCEGAQAALGSSLALRRIAERSSDRSAAGSPSPARRGDHAAGFGLRSTPTRQDAALQCAQIPPAGSPGLLG